MFANVFLATDVYAASSPLSTSEITDDFSYGYTYPYNEDKTKVHANAKGLNMPIDDGDITLYLSDLGILTIVEQYSISDSNSPDHIFTNLEYATQYTIEFNVISSGNGHQGTQSFSFRTDTEQASLLIFDFSLLNNLSNEITATWKTDKSVASGLQYSRLGSNEIKEVNLQNSEYRHSVRVTGLAGGQTYTFTPFGIVDGIKFEGDTRKVVVQDAVAEVVDNTFSNFLVSSKTSTSVTLTWTTQESVGTQILIDGNIHSKENAPTTTHTYTVNNLSPGTVYTFYAYATPRGVAVKSKGLSVTTDIELATFTNLKAEEVHANSVVLSWNSSVISPNLVEYQELPNGTTLQFVDALQKGTFHRTTLAGLNANTRYRINVYAYSTDGSQIARSESIYITTPVDKSELPLITNVLFEERPKTTATFTYQINRVSTNPTVIYGTSPNALINVRNDSLLTQNATGYLAKITLVGLVPSTTYYYQIILDRGTAGEYKEPINSFRTIDGSFKILSVSVDSVDALGNRAEDVRSFGITFDQAYSKATLTLTDVLSGEKTHEETITNASPAIQNLYISPGKWTRRLQPNRQYSWKIVAYNVEYVPIRTEQTGVFHTTDFDNEDAKNSTFYFTNFRAINVSSESIIFAWDTSEPIITEMWFNNYQYGDLTHGPTTSHSFTMGGLSPNKQYTFYAYSDKYNETSTPLTITTASLSSVARDVLTTEYFDIKFPYDNNKTTAVMYWSTNRPTTSSGYITTVDESEHTGNTLYFGTDVVYEEYHSQSIDNLKEYTKYFVVLNSTDKFGGSTQHLARFTTGQSIHSNDTIVVDSGDADSSVQDTLLREVRALRDIVKEQQTKISYLEKITQGVKSLSVKLEEVLNSFITYGVDENTEKLGAGERAAVVSSYKSAFNKLPDSDIEVNDLIKIANGRFPTQRNEATEKIAKQEFQRIYKRIPNLNNQNDLAAVMVMSYGLRQKAENRNLNSEKQGIKIFEGIYGHVPNTTDEWNIMQAITYSGASRSIDSDKDFLPDDRERELGTDPNNPDTDGDGYLDGIEVINGYDPLR